MVPLSNLLPVKASDLALLADTALGLYARSSVHDERRVLLGKDIEEGVFHCSSKGGRVRHLHQTGNPDSSLWAQPQPLRMRSRSEVQAWRIEQCISEAPTQCAIFNTDMLHILSVS